MATKILTESQLDCLRKLCTLCQPRIGRFLRQKSQDEVALGHVRLIGNMRLLRDDNEIYTSVLGNPSIGDGSWRRCKTRPCAGKNHRHPRKTSKTFGVVVGRVFRMITAKSGDLKPCRLCKVYLFFSLPIVGQKVVDAKAETPGEVFLLNQLEQLEGNR